MHRCASAKSGRYRGALSTPGAAHIRRVAHPSHRSHRVHGYRLVIEQARHRARIAEACIKSQWIAWTEFVIEDQACQQHAPRVRALPGPRGKRRAFGGHHHRRARVIKRTGGLACLMLTAIARMRRLLDKVNAARKRIVEPCREIGG